MASSRKRKKQAAIDRKAHQVGPRRTRDGDRRRRSFGSIVDDVLDAQRRARDWNLDAPGADVLLGLPPEPGPPVQ